MNRFTRRVAGFILASACLLQVAHGGVRVSLRLESSSALLFERVRAYIKLYNDTDYPFVIDMRTAEGLAASKGKLALEIHRGEDVQSLRPTSPPFSYVYLLPDEEEELMVDLSEHFPMAAMGRYKIRATTRHHKRSFVSGLALLDVVKGIEVAKTARSIPDYPGRLRVYSLRHWERNGSRQLFISIDEPDEGYNYGVFALGEMMRVTAPIVRADRKGNVLVIHQAGVDRFTHTRLKSTRDEVRLLDQTYHLANGEPYESRRESAPMSPTAAKPARRWWQVWKWGRR